MVALDGNSIGGLLLDVFGTDMTAALTTCATCGAVAPVAETVVYLRVPGTVMRCRSLVFVVFMGSSPIVCERRMRTTPWSQRTSGVVPVRRKGRMVEGRSPVAKPRKVIAYCAGNSSFMVARKAAASSLVRVFGCSSV